jgi:hypothetical protein
MAIEANIFISLSPSLRKRFEGYEAGVVRNGVLLYAEQLWKAVSGMEESVIQFQWSEKMDSNTILTINGKMAVIPDVFAQKLPFMDMNEHFIQYICKGLLSNRALFITDELIVKYKPEYPFFNDQLKDNFRRLSLLFIEFGYGVSLLSEINAPDFDEKPFYEIFELAVQSFNGVSLTLSLHPEIQQHYHEGDISSGSENFSLMCEGIYQQYGVLAPKITVQYDSDISFYECRLRINQLPFPLIKTIDTFYFVCNQPTDDTTLNFDHPVTPGHPNTSGTFSYRSIETMEKDRYSVWGTLGVWVLQISGLIRQYAGWFCNGFAFDTLWEATMHNPMGTRLLEKYHKLFLTHVVRRLHQQGLFTRNFYRIMEAVLLTRQSVVSDIKTIEFFHHPMVLAVDIHPAELALQDPRYVAEGVRNYLRYELVANLGFPTTFFVMLLDPSFENALFGNEKHMSLNRSLLDELELEIRHFESNIVLHGILTIDAIRHRVDDMLRECYPFLKVIAYNELPAEANIQPISRLSPNLLHKGADI